jgi:hypothetical protein
MADVQQQKRAAEAPSKLKLKLIEARDVMSRAEIAATVAAFGGLLGFSTPPGLSRRPRSTGSWVRPSSPPRRQDCAG